MSASLQQRMSADEFIAWSIDQPTDERYELFDGRIVAMVGERLAHVRGKQTIFLLLRDAIAAAGLTCEAFVDGTAVRISETSVYEPDALVRCGAPLDGDTVVIADPIIVVEVLSPSSRARDALVKLGGYFRLPSLHHYLIVDLASPTVIHHARGEGGTILTRIVPDGPVRLDPPGIVLDGIFPEAQAR
jgi:Uma2 family endonuclease